MNRIKIVVLLILVWMAGAGMAQSQKTWFEEGNAAYNNGDYEIALNKYKQIVDFGLESASLYYNMGNAHYKMKDYPHAIYYYEKALKLDPSNEDIQTNLQIANMAIVDKIDPIPQSFPVRWWNSLKSVFSVDGWAWMSIVSFALLLSCLLVFMLSRRMAWRKFGFFVGLVLLLVLVVSVTFSIDKHLDLTRQDEAIVMTPTVTVKSSPNTASVDLFVLHEGTKVRIMDSTGEWSKIKIADGSVGWLQIKDMEAF